MLPLGSFSVGVLSRGYFEVMSLKGGVIHGEVCRCDPVPDVVRGGRPLLVVNLARRIRVGETEIK